MPSEGRPFEAAPFGLRDVHGASFRLDVGAAVRHLAVMTLATLALFYLACGAATFPLSLIALRYAASLSPASRLAQRIGSGFEAALSLSLVIWIVGATAFYVVALQIERQKACDQQHTNQLTAPCRKLLGAPD